MKELSGAMVLALPTITLIGWKSLPRINCGLLGPFLSYEE
jgi:hypothetical protein